MNNLIGKFTLIAFLLVTEIASAFYDANLGRWFNRDPLGDEGSLVQLMGKYETRVEANPIMAAVTGPFETWGGLNLYAYVENSPINFIDPFGLSSIHAQVLSAVGRGDVAALESLLATGQLNAAQTAMVQAALNKYRSTALQWIAQKCKGSIGREFPSQLYNKTLEQIKNGTDAASKKAWKLLNKKEFQK